MVTYKDMATTFKHVKEDVEDRIKCGAAIYGRASTEIAIAETVGVQPSKKLFETGRQSVDCRKQTGTTPITFYSLKEASLPAIAICLGDASKDDLNLFAILADPHLVSVPRIQDAFYARLESLQAEEAAVASEDMTAVHEAETAEFREYMGYMQGAQIGGARNDTFYHRDYSEDKEYPNLIDVGLARYKSGNYTEVVPMDIPLDDTPTE